MKRMLLFILISMGWVTLFAQSMPDWVKHRPKASNSTFYYRVTIGEGSTYTLAYSNAFAKAILESSWKIGVQVTTSDDLETIKNDIYENISIGQVESNIPINKVCEYLEQQSSTKYRLYCLWQVGKPAQVVQFDEFYDCN